MRTRNEPRGRTAVLSTGAHAALLALLALAGGSGRAPTPQHPAIINAELVTLKPAEREAVPVPSDAPAEAAEGPATPQAAVPPPERLPERPAEATEPPPAPRAAAVAETPTPPEPAPTPPAPAEPPAPSAERVADVAELPAPEAVAPPSDRAPIGAEPPVAPAPSGRPLEAPQQAMLSKRLASWTGRFTPGEPTPTLAWREDGQQYTAVLTPLPAAHPMGMEQLAVEIVTERDGERLVTDLRLNRVAFSSFAQFVDRWDPDVQIHDDVIDGRFHSNSEIRVSRERGVAPIFRGKVTLAARDVATDGPGRLNRRSMFPAGLETSVRRIPLPPRAAALGELDVPAEHTQRFHADTAITFHADGSYEWQALDGGAATRRSLGAAPHYLIGAEDAVLHVRGVVNGTVLVYTPDRIVIADDVRYAADPRRKGADDYLGLVAERSVEVGGPELTGMGDLEVHASIYARRQFAVRNFRSRPSGTLRIYGSLTSGSLTATEPRFATKIEFDERLTAMRAPGFPLSDRYELASWSGEWRALPP